MTKLQSGPSAGVLTGACVLAGAIMLLAPALAFPAGLQQTRLNIAPGGILIVDNNSGSVTLHPGADQAVLVNATTHSDKVEVDATATPDGGRVDIRSHALPQQHPTADESRVDYDITVPLGISVTVSTATAPITIDNLKGDLSLSSETGQITVRNVYRSHLHVRGVSGLVQLSSVNNSHVEVSSTGGNVQLTDVTGSGVTVGTTSGNITYDGDFSGGGQYKFSTHNGEINIAAPESASFDLSARTQNGTVQNAFPLKDKAHSLPPPRTGAYLVGTSHNGSSSVEVTSFSGRIRVKKK